MLLRVLFLKKRRGPRALIVLSRVDVKDAFGQVLVDPAGAPVFGHTIGSQVVVDVRLQFVTRSRVPTRAAAVERVKIAPSGGVPVLSLPRVCRPIPGRVGHSGSWFFVRCSVDDSILVEVQW